MLSLKDEFGKKKLFSIKHKVPLTLKHVRIDAYFKMDD